MGRKFCVGGNWKMNGDKASITDLCKTLTTGPLSADTEVVVGCPAPYLTLARSQLPDSVGVAAQVSNQLHSIISFFSVVGQRSDCR